jgi:RNA polymerase sigma-70 factor (ECF subfamily)
MTTEEFEIEIVRLRPKLIEKARRYLRDNDEAEDVVQDALCRLWQMCDRLHLPMDALAMVLTRNLCINKLQRQKPTVSLGQHQAEGDNTSNHQRVERMMSIIETLPELQQLILRLHHMEGMKTRDIAEMTQMSEAAIRKALSRARMMVREKYLNNR